MLFCLFVLLSAETGLGQCCRPGGVVVCLATSTCSLRRAISINCPGERSLTERGQFCCQALPVRLLQMVRVADRQPLGDQGPECSLLVACQSPMYFDKYTLGLGSGPVVRSLSGSATGTRPCGSRPSGSSLGGLGPVEVVALVGSLRITQEELAAPSPTGGFRLWRWEHPGQVGAVFGLTHFTTATNYDQRSIETVPAPLYGTEEGYRTSRTGPG